MSTSVPTDPDSTAGSTPAGGAPAVAQPLHSASEAASQTAATSSPSTPLLMQIVVRKDLLEDGWGVGPLMAQAAHAATAVIHETRDHPDTKAYLDDLPNMRKVVLQTSDENSLRRLSDLLSTTSPNPPVPHHLWIEQPENVPTCIALIPNRRESKIKKALDKSGCRLWKG